MEEINSTTLQKLHSYTLEARKKMESLINVNKIEEAQKPLNEMLLYFNRVRIKGKDGKYLTTGSGEQK